MKNTVTVDVQTIFHKKEQRTLSAGYKFYCGKDLDGAHSAAVDTNATYEILLAQLEKYPDLTGASIKEISEFSTRKKSVDFAGFIVLNNKEDEVFSFGKHKGKKVTDVLQAEPGYYNWIQNADFPLYTKKVLTAIKLRQLTNKF